MNRSRREIFIFLCLCLVLSLPAGTLGDTAFAEPAAAYRSIVIDYGDEGYSESGSWTTSAGVKGANGSSTRYTSIGGSSITWNPRLKAGTVTVSVYKVNWPDKADPKVKVDVVHNGKTDSFNLNMTTPSSGWIELGTFDFSGNGVEYVSLTRTTGSSSLIYTRADAVKFEGFIEQQDPPPGPLRSRELPDLSYTEKGVITNGRYKAVFYEAAWDGGRSIVRDLYYNDNSSWIPVHTEAERLEEQWVLLEGNSGKRSNYYETMTPRWITFDSVQFPDAHTAVLTDASSPGKYGFEVTWSLAGGEPDVSYAFTPHADGHYVIGYQSFTAERQEDVTEVLSGFRSHAKMIGTVESTGLWELTAPMSLVQKNSAGNEPLTYGLFVPAEELPLEYEPAGGAANQRLGMSLVNNDGAVQPILYAPQLGSRSLMTAGSTYRFHIGLTARKSGLYDAYRDILRSEYGYSPYRSNAPEGSLTDAMFRMIDLIKTEPPGDDSVDYVPSESGWWSRAKGFIDIENEDAVRTTTNGVLLGAYYLTGDDELYDTRALPSIQYGVSRNGVGWSPKRKPVYGSGSEWKMASLPFDISTVAAVYQMTGNTARGIYAMGEEEFRFRNPEQKDRGPVIQPLMMYRMTGDADYLQQARTAADSYIAQAIDAPETVNPPRTDFVFNFGKLWVELLELYEETKEPVYLNAAYKEAKRYSTMFVARPVPEGQTKIPEPEQYPYRESFHWPQSAKFDYPRDRLTEDEAGGVLADNWIVSPNGLTYEAGSTSSAYRMNAQEAPFLLRLAAYTGDTLLADIAHNAVIGRYASYPGYYYRALAAGQLEAEYPWLGPSEATSIYYHHIPAQLGQTIDYLITEQMRKSNGHISFPSVFETDFLWFKYHLYGHQPGTFYGYSDVWLWMPEGVIDPHNAQLNWITAESGDRFYMSLVNESDTVQQTTIDLNADLIGFDPLQEYPVVIIRDNGAPEPSVMRNGKIDISVPGKGIAAVVVEGLDIQVPLHRPKTITDHSDASYFFDTHSPIDAVKGMLFVKPDESGYDAYVQAKTDKPATLHYSLDGGATYTVIPDAIYPMEWSVRVSDLSRTFTYYVESENKRTQEKTLYLPDRAAAPPPQPPVPPAASVVVDNTEAETEGVWVRDTSAEPYYYDSYAYAKTTTGTATSRIVWRPELPKGVAYSVYYKLPAAVQELSPNATFTIHYDGGTQNLTVNQRMSDGGWTYLGTYPFAAGKSGYVSLTNRASGSRVAADAVMWVNAQADPVWDSAYLSVGRTMLETTRSVPLQLTGYYKTGLPGDLTGAAVQYQVNRPDLAEVDGNGVLTLHRLDGQTSRITVRATVSIDGVTLETPPLWLDVRELSVIVDSTSSGAYSEQGSWVQSGLSGYNKTVKSRYTTEQGASAEWKAVVPAGVYTISYYNIVNHPGADPNVKIDIKHQSVTEATYVDASSGTSGWIELGTFRFDGNGGEYVKATRVGADPLIYTRVDAVRFERRSD